MNSFQNHLTGFLTQLFILILISITFSSYGEELVARGSTWKYDDSGANLGTSWRTTAYDDSGWSSGAGKLGFSDSPTTTLTNHGGITYYFRYEFSITDTSHYEDFTFSLLRDDGVVVYVNGTEVWRDNMPVGTINYNTPATTFVGGADEDTYFTNTLADIFVNGTNVIAVELHQQSTGSSDIGFDLGLDGNIPNPYFDFGATWKYLDDGTNQGTAWKESAFVDSTWSTGTAEFGYGDGDESTVISYGGDAANKHITTYFRKHFTVEDVSNINHFKIDMIKDDGAILYINGTEFYRNNMPLGAVNYTTLADSAVSYDFEDSSYAIIAPAELFVDGNNVFAVEIHQGSSSSSDLSFDLSLSADTIDQSDSVLVNLESYWNYHDKGVNLGTNWRNTTYEETVSGWEAGNAELGYGDGDENTELSYGSDASNKYRTYYFRHYFTVNEFQDYDSLFIRLRRDDGAIVYVNGTEVARSSMPTGTVSYNTFANVTAASADETTLFEFTHLANVLNIGTNVIAVEVHQTNASSSDMSMDLELSIIPGDEDNFVINYENISGKTFLDADFTKSFSVGDYTSGALLIEAYQDENGNGIIDDTDPRVETAMSNLEGDYSIPVYPPSITAKRGNISASANDAIENGSDGSVNLTSTTLTSPNALDEIGLRFPDIQIPKDANVVAAKLILKARSTSNDTIRFVVDGQAADNAAAFTTATNNLSSRSRTTNSVNYTTTSPVINQQEIEIEGLELIIKEITDRASWSIGNALALFITGAENTYSAYDGGDPAVLVIAYETEGNTTVDYILNVAASSLPKSHIFLTDPNPIITLSNTGRRALTGNDIGYLGTTSICVAGADAENELHIINRFNGQNRIVGSYINATEVEAMALSLNADSIFAVDADEFGIIDFTTGEFMGYGNTIGTGGGSLGALTFSDIDGLSFDLSRRILWASHRRNGAPDVILQINPATGTHVADAFGAGIDYLVTSGAGLFNDLDDIGVDPVSGDLLAMNNDGGAVTNLIRIDVTTGSITVVNSTGLDDMEGQGFHNDGIFYSTSGNSGNNQNTFYEVDTSDASLTEVGFFSSGGDFESCDCKTSPFLNFIEGVVYSDENENGFFDEGTDIIDAGVQVYLYEDLDDDSIITGADLLIDSFTTDATGSYFFSVNRDGVFLTNLQMADIPEGSTLTTPPQQEARFRQVGVFDENNDFGYRESELLPVELVSFSGERIERKHHLYWTTTSEVNNDFFNIQRSSDGISFKNIGAVNGAGNTNVMQRYVFTDEQPIIGVNYYRLEQVDFDKSKNYSETISLINKNEFSAGLETQLKLWPNPVMNELNISGIGNLEGDIIYFTIINVYGRVVWKKTISNTKEKSVNFLLNNFAEGYYIIEIEANNFRKSLPFIRQKK